MATPGDHADDRWAPCSDRSRERADPLPGTGGYGERWFLLEIDGSWGEHAFLESAIDPVLGRAIARRGESEGLRPVAIRRLGRRADERRHQSPYRWAIADARPGRESMRWGEVTDPGELLDVPLDGSAGEPADRPAFLVCTHARHDRCCAVRGRPVATALAEAFPEETWECSHLGGDRFAATMILLPHGLYYGRVPADEVVQIARTYEAGLIRPEYFRGRSSLSMVVQAAQSHVREQLKDDRIDAFLPVGEEPRRDGEEWVVELANGEQAVTVTLRDAWSQPLLSTCAATTPARVRRFEAVSIAPRATS